MVEAGKLQINTGMCGCYRGNVVVNGWMEE